MKNNLLILLLFFTINSISQNTLSLTIDNGYMINADPGFLKMGLGGAVTYNIVNYLPIGSFNNYITLTGSVINYPHADASYSLKHFNNGVDDAFHFAKFQAGYKIGLRIPEQSGSYLSYLGWKRSDGLFLEYRAGTAVYNFSFNNPTFIITACLHYVKHNLQLSFYSDYGQAKYHTNIGYITIFAAGFSAGVNF